MPNGLAYLMLLVWPMVTFLLFVRLPPDRALIWSILGGYLLLPPPPALFDFPLLPPLSKETIPSLAAFAAAMALHRTRGPLLPESAAARLLLAVFVLTPMATVLTNMHPVVFGRVWLPSLGLKDSLALVVHQFLLLIPFLLARQFLRDGGSHRALLRALVVATLVYSVPMLVEVRLSPQMNVWVYGYFQHLFEQMTRGEGYRPIVFLYHGLWAAFLAMTAAIAALGLWRLGGSRPRGPWLAAALWLGAVLVLCKSLASLIYGLFLAPLVLLLSPRLQLGAAAILALLAVGYPVAKGTHLFPAERVLAAATAIDAERAASLKFRFDNEDVLLQRAEQKPLFGWGSWGRNHIHDPASGEILTVTDGRWIITLGVYGWFGFLAEFLLIAAPILLLWREARAHGAPVLPPLAGPLALLLAINLVDMIPNATLTPLTWVMSGALWGLAEEMRRARRPQRAAAAPVWQSVL